MWNKRRLDEFQERFNQAAKRLHSRSRRRKAHITRLIYVNDMCRHLYSLVNLMAANKDRNYEWPAGSGTDKPKEHRTHPGARGGE
jgi:hypothetical protein